MVFFIDEARSRPPPCLLTNVNKKMVFFIEGFLNRSLQMQKIVKSKSHEYSISYYRRISYLLALGQNYVLLLSPRSAAITIHFFKNHFAHIIMLQSHTSKCSTHGIIILSSIIILILRSVTVHHPSVYYLLPWMELQRRLVSCSCQ